MKKIILTLAVVIGGVNPLMATAIEELKDTTGKPAANVSQGAAGTAVASAIGSKAANVFHGTSTTQTTGSLPGRFGVQKDAEELAIANCMSKGFSTCRVIGSVIESCNNGLCVANATAAPLIPVPGAKVFSATDEWLGSGYSGLEQRGVRKSAEDMAVYKCQSEGFMGCVAIGSTMGNCASSTYKCAATGMAQAHTVPQ